MKISTKGGDKGKTSLVFGRRVSKACQRVRAYGALDEFSAQLAMARAFAGKTQLGADLLKLQEKLVPLMTELATAKEDFAKLAEKNIKILGKEDLAEIESKIEKIEAEHGTFSGWKHPGETPLDAALDLARAKCRAAEREIVALCEDGELARDFPITYVNRVSDLLYLL